MNYSDELYSQVNELVEGGLTDQQIRDELCETDDELLNDMIDEIRNE
jgi:hypothetical protein